MIKLNKLNDKEFILNCDQIEKIEMNPDSTITMMNGHVYVVKDNIEDIIKKVIEYKRNYSINGQRGEI
ncbi:flagellar FlbD family protein [Oceanotoga sp. DSM 15011]|jgi:flagellar protein FlbD|uniref:Flagellar protein FlbD n=1 Tax=Oceanotoga teriensis TaxID=515440 RepID=A0AA45HJN2_9BACT|nr:MULTISPECIES: flagellar FlbD family protein [Oceanotoga]MDN5342102.1 flagellar protein FlbD [Oceanotoga sp.]MDO7975428.1 flagellar FlbD family protein [Oceanotoga teriensis]PWJ96284.1 flagellar protein FlbD [Oceanotoga teriensis]UYP00068.1 flagellar FlbD family protein [Oceanotoga sp. DSM 15011]